MSIHVRHGIGNRRRRLDTLAGAVSVAFTLLCLAWLPAIPAAAAPGPVKLSIQPKAQSVPVGGPMQMKCVLEDANNRPATAPKDMAVELEVKWPSGKTQKWSGKVKRGASSYELTVPAVESGIVEIQARQKELLNGSTFIKVKRTNTLSRLTTMSAPLPVMRAPATVASAPAPQPVLATAAPRTVRLDTNATLSRVTERAAAPRSLRTEAVVAAAAPAPMLAASGGGAAAPPSTPEDAGLLLRAETRKYLADGKHKATILAFLDDEVGTAGNIQVNLFSDRGHMDPTPLVIPQGEDVARVELTSDQVGTVTVEFLSSRPQLKVRSGKELQIAFGPPITEMQFRSSPPKLSLLEKAELVVKLVDADKTLVATDEPRQVDLEILEGNGSIDSSVLTVASNAATAHATFTPTRRGRVRIAASTPDLMTAVADVTVTFPVMLALCSLAGSALGGALASSLTNSRRHQKRGWYVRVLVGLVTGFVFYYFGILGFITALPATVALNPIGAIVLSIVGGWMGTEVFTPILQWLGLAKKQA